MFHRRSLYSILNTKDNDNLVATSIHSHSMKWTNFIIGSDNGLLCVQRQSNIWPSDGLLFIGNMGINFSKTEQKQNNS